MADAGDSTLTTDLDSMVAAFAEENPTLMAELKVLGMQIDEYNRLLAESEPRIIVTDNTGGYSL